MGDGPFRPQRPARTIGAMHSDSGRSGPLRVVIVDADERVRESLAGLLCIGDQLCVVGSAGQTGPAIDLVLATEPDIVVLDPRFPEPDAGLSFIHRLRALAPGVRILVMSGTDHPNRPTSSDPPTGSSARRSARATWSPPSSRRPCPSPGEMQEGAPLLDSTDSERSFQPPPDTSAPGAHVTDQTKIRVLI